MKWILAIVVAGCSSKTPTPPTHGSDGTVGSGTATSCDQVRAKVEELYRAEAKVKEPKRVEEAVADNTTMVMNDCAKAPAKVAACVSASASISDIEHKCLRPLDDEGTEGLELRK